MKLIAWLWKQLAGLFLWVALYSPLFMFYGRFMRHDDEGVIDIIIATLLAILPIYWIFRIFMPETTRGA